MPRPTPRASSGRRLAPKISTRIVTMTSSSGIPSEPILRLLSRRPFSRYGPAVGCPDSITGSATLSGVTTAAAAGLLLAVAATSAGGQTPQFGTSVQVVEVYASVTDGKGEPIRGLGQAQFTVREDGEVQSISTFVEGEFPLSVAVAVDRSWSMAGDRLATAKEGARTLLNALRSSDQAMVVAVSGAVETVALLSNDRSAQLAALDRLDPWSTTALHDAVIAAIDRVQAGSGRRALVLLSDSTDRYSRADAAAVLEHARRSDVMVYPIALGRERSPLFAELAVL